MLEAVSIVGIFIFLTVSYYLMTSKVTAKARVGSALSVLSREGDQSPFCVNKMLGFANS